MTEQKIQALTQSAAFVASEASSPGASTAPPQRALSGNALNRVLSGQAFEEASLKLLAQWCVQAQLKAA